MLFEASGEGGRGGKCESEIPFTFSGISITRKRASIKISGGTMKMI